MATRPARSSGVLRFAARVRSHAGGIFYRKKIHPRTQPLNVVALRDIQRALAAYWVLHPLSSVRAPALNSRPYRRPNISLLHIGRGAWPTQYINCGPHIAHCPLSSSTAAQHITHTTTTLDTNTSECALSLCAIHIVHRNRSHARTPPSVLTSRPATRPPSWASGPRSRCGSGGRRGSRRRGRPPCRRRPCRQRRRSRRP